MLRRNNAILRPPDKHSRRFAAKILLLQTRRKGLSESFIMSGFQDSGRPAMEAEHINSISYKLDDLAQRAAELRRYL
jgi:hypothetical protein